MSDGREGGFIVVWRRVQSSPLFQCLTAQQRSVFFSILLLANWKDRQIYVGGKPETVRRGELLQSLEAIAEHAKVSVKVVRTTIAKMFADDRPVGGRGPFLTERWIGLGREVGSESGIAEGTAPGRPTGTPLRVLTVVNYDAYQTLNDDEGMGSGTVTDCVTGTSGAREGHARGTSRTKETKRTKGTTTDAPAAPSPADERFQPFVKSAFDVFQQERQSELDFDGHDGKRLKEFLSRQPKVTVEEFSARWKRALGLRAWPGCAKVAHLLERWNDLAGPGPPLAVANERGRQAVGKDWSKTL